MGVVCSVLSILGPRQLTCLLKVFSMIPLILAFSVNYTSMGESSASMKESAQCASIVTFDAWTAWASHVHEYTFADEASVVHTSAFMNED